MTIAESDEDQRCPPIALFNMAESYWKSARALRDAKVKATHAEMPIQHHYYHAIELYLKAFLRLHGLSVKELASRTYGHRTHVLATKAAAFSLQFDDEDLEVVELMGKTDVVIRSRYHRTGFIRVPTLEALDRTCKSLRGSVGNALRASGTSVRMR